MLSLNRITPLNNPNLFNQLMAEFRNFISLPSINFKMDGTVTNPGDVAGFGLINVNQKLMSTFVEVSIQYMDKKGEIVYEEFTLEEGFSPGGEQVIVFRRNIVSIE
ncbi:MAG: hypothetical protein ACRCTP_04395 [Aeromonas popoffii]|uniref:hypothetical protein n=1 Tax=Aeromonas popoffii TaxID=70856 RepID=UPI003F36A821